MTLKNSVDKAGYKYICFGEGRYLQHRVIYYMHHKELPKKITFFDGDTTNTRIENLLVGQHPNRVPNKSNKSGHKNIIWWEARKKWRVSIKRGAVKYRGYFSKLEDAVEKVDKFRRQYDGRDNVQKTVCMA